MKNADDSHSAPPSRQGEGPSTGAPLAHAVGVALTVAVLTSLAAAAALFGGIDATWRALDFNGAPFEDFLGPYWQTAQNLVAGRSEPAPGYVYPSTLAWLLAPAVTLGGGPLTASFLATAMVLLSLKAILAAAFSLAPCRSLSHAALLGAVLGAAHAPIHGAYWAQASLPAFALMAIAFSLSDRGRPALAGVALGFAAAIKLYPAAGLLVLLAPRLSATRPSAAGLSSPRHRWRGARALSGAFVGTVLTAGVLLPVALMGIDSFLAFHRSALGSLGRLVGWVFSGTAGAGSQDVPTVLFRLLGLESPAFARVVGILLAVALTVWAARALLRGTSDGTLLALVLLAALPWAAVSPTWPHGLLWVPLGWYWVSRGNSRLAHGLAGLSFAAGSIFALRAAGTPQGYAAALLPASSAALALAALVAADASGRSTRVTS